MRRSVAVVLALGGLALAAAPLAAQVRTIDPNQAGSMAAAPGSSAAPPPSSAMPAEPAPAATEPAPAPAAPPRAPAGSEATYQDNDIFGAAEGVFGKGAEGLAKIIERIIGDHGRPNAYIAGREAGGAFAVGVRYGSGTLYHKVEGERPVYWTGPSLGFDVGANGSKTFVLVYNLYDSAELYKRFPAAEGRLYFVGGFAATYLRRGNVVLIPVRLGVGWRAGVNVGYMNFTQKSKWLPF